MRQKLKIIIVLMLILGLMPSLPVLASPLVIESGYVGVNGAPWRLYDNGNLVVSEGRIHSAAVVSPWDAYRGNITNIIFEGPITTGHSLRALFSNLTYVESIVGLELFDTSNVTVMQSLFSGLNNVVALNLSGWDTSNVVNMSSMFNEASSLVSLDVSGWDTSNVTHMSHMFRDAEALLSLDVSGWDTSRVTTMATMFYGATSLAALDVSGWDTSQVTTMNRIFSNAASLTVLDVSSWDTSNVTDMTRMFQGAGELTNLDVSGWNTSNVTNMIGMFHGASGITSLDVSNWDTSNVTNMERMFPEASGLTSLDVSNWDTSNVTSMGSMFFGATGLVSLDVSNWDTSRVTNMNGMFRNTSALTHIDVSNWNTARVTSMATMFYGASALTSLDVSDWDTRSVTTMDRMFTNASGITTLDVSGWYTGAVINMQGMFQGFSGVGALDVSGWDTSNVTSMARMFLNVGGVTELDVSSWDTSSVTSMLSMFQGVSGVTSLDVSGWDTRLVTNMQNMFFGTSSLISLDLSSWDVGNVTTMHSMFRGANGLTSLDISGWDTGRTPAVIMIDMFRDTHALRRITFGDNFTNGDTNDPRLPIRASSSEFTGLWLNITPPGGMPAVASNVLLPTTGGGPHAPGIWVWERHEGIVMLTVDGTYRFPTVAVGYPPVNPLLVAVANAGRTDINVPLTITLSGANADDFILEHGALPPGGVIPVGSSWAGAFSIVPALGLEPGTYTASVTVSGEGINTETFTVSFTVLPDSIEHAVITFADAVFNGNPQQPAFIVTLEGEVLTEGIDYEVVPSSWVNNINARNSNDSNPPSVTIRGIGIFERPGSEATRAFTIRPRPVTLTRGSFSLTKVYDGTASPAGATQSGVLALANLAPNDSLRVRVQWTSISDFSGIDVGVYDATLFGISLMSINNDDWHLNYDLGIAILTEIPAHITPALFPPIQPIERTVMIGEARTVTVPIGELTPLPLIPMNLGMVNSVVLHNYAPGTISATATIIGDNLIITTLADKTFPATETVTVRFDTQNFGNIDVQVALTTTAQSLFNITYALTGPTPATINNMPTTPQAVAAGTTNVSVASWPTTDATTNAEGVAGIWTFSGWATNSSGVTIDGDVPNQTFTMPNNNVEFTGSWSFVADTLPPVITIVTHPAAITLASGAALNIDLSVTANVTQGATLEYQWFSNTSNSNTGGMLIPGATGQSFLIPNNLTVGTFYFYVVVSATGAESVTSNVAIVIVPEEDFRGIAINPGSDHSFPAAYFGYGLQVAHAVTILSIGTKPTGPITIGLSGANAGSFELSITSLTDIAVEGSSMFTIRPISGLNVGVYSAIVSIAGDDILESFTVSFAVIPPVIIATPVPTPQPTHTPTKPPQQSPVPEMPPRQSPTPAIPPPPQSSAPEMLLQPSPAPDMPQQPSLTPSIPLQSMSQTSPPPSQPPQTSLPITHTPQTPVLTLEPERHLAYMFGDTNGDFRPQGFLTRAEAATILARVMLLDFEYGIRFLPPGMSTFDAFADVRPGQWFYYYVAWAYDAELVQGFAGNFRPNDPITREELAAIIVRTQETSFLAGTTSFTDAADASAWARTYVNVAYNQALMIGDPNGAFRPQHNITRAETATAINRLLGRIDSRVALQAAITENINYARWFPDVATAAWYFPSIIAATNDHYLTRDNAGVIDWKYIVQTHNETHISD